MCAITGVVVNKGTKSKEILTFAKELFTKLYIETKSGGSDAAGVASLAEGFEVNYAKAPLSVPTFIKTSQYQDWLNTIGEETFVLIGHARAATSGKAIDNNNNHPHIFGRTIGIHNGGFSGHEEKAKALGINLTTECDSELLIAAYDVLRSRMEATTKEALGFIQKKIMGSFAAAMFNKTDGDKLILCRNHVNLDLIKLKCKINNQYIMAFHTNINKCGSVLNDFKAYLDYNGFVRTESELNTNNRYVKISSPTEIEHGDF